MRKKWHREMLNIQSKWMCCVLILGCGRNVLENRAPKNLEEQAELDMEASRYSAAQTKLESYLIENPVDFKAVSLLAASLAAQAGITMFALLQKAVAVQSASPAPNSSAPNSIDNMLTILPQIEEGTIAKMELACTKMASIPIISRTAEMTLQTSVFFSALVFLKLKRLKENPALLAALTPEEVLDILGNLASAVPPSSQPGDPVSKGATIIQAQIASASGSSNVEKLKSVLAASNSPR